MTLNKILLIGNLGSDPEMRYIPSGSAVSNFSLAVNRRYTTSAGEQREETEWFRIAAWGQLAETANQYLQKGSKVYVEGRVASRAYTDKDGQARASIEVTAERIQFLDPKGTTYDQGALPPERSGVAPPANEIPGGPPADGPPADGPPPAEEEVEELPW